MENFDQPLDVGMTSSGPDDSGLSITPEIRQYWREIANWALFFAVLTFLYYITIVSFGLLEMSKVEGGGAGVILADIFLVVLYTAFLFMPAWYYYKFASQSKQAMNMDDTELLDAAFVNLHRFYRYTGILVIIYISLCVLAFLFMGAALSGLGE